MYILNLILNSDVNPDDIIVTCGIISQLERVTENDRQVHEILLHPGFEEANLKYDFGLLVLKEEFDLKQNILNVICLPPNRSFNEFDHSKCVATGWGSDPTDKTDNNDKRDLRKEILPFIGFNECQSALRSQPELNARFQLHESFVCAGGMKDEGSYNSSIR